MPFQWPGALSTPRCTCARGPHRNERYISLRNQHGTPMFCRRRRRHGTTPVLVLSFRLWRRGKEDRSPRREWWRQTNCGMRSSTRIWTFLSVSGCFLWRATDDCDTAPLSQVLCLSTILPPPAEKNCITGESVLQRREQRLNKVEVVCVRFSPPPRQKKSCAISPRQPAQSPLVGFLSQSCPPLLFPSRERCMGECADPRPRVCACTRTTSISIQSTLTKMKIKTTSRRLKDFWSSRHR